MLKSELFEIIANGESSTVDFKRDDCRSEQLAKEIVAMVNHNGGQILLGVEDDGEISGIHRDDLEEWVMDVVVSRKVHPQILPSYQEVLIDEGKRVAILSFTQGSAKPYVLRHNSREEIFVRVGSTSRLASREQRSSSVWYQVEFYILKRFRFLVHPSALLTWQESETTWTIFSKTLKFHPQMTGGYSGSLIWNF